MFWMSFEWMCGYVFWNLKVYKRKNAPDSSISHYSLRVVTIAMIYYTLGSLWKFQYFWRPVNNSVKHLWWRFNRQNCKPLSLFTNKSIVDIHLKSKSASCFVKTLQIFHFFRVFYIVRLLKSVNSLEYFTSFNSSNMLLNTESWYHLTYEILFHWVE